MICLAGLEFAGPPRPGRRCGNVPAIGEPAWLSDITPATAQLRVAEHEAQQLAGDVAAAAEDHGGHSALRHVVAAP